jgi:carbon-monoxide dehydrogenase small subunit
VSEALTLRINGAPVVAEAASDDERLLDTLRWRLGLRGTKEGCRSGACGACTVLVDGRPTLSCLTLTREVDGREITTIEGVTKVPAGKVVVEAFETEGAVQCGYCTPGFVMTLTGLLERTPKAHRTLARLLDQLQGNLCRCTGYAAIVRAVERAQREAPG